LQKSSAIVPSGCPRRSIAIGALFQEDTLALLEADMQIDVLGSTSPTYVFDCINRFYNPDASALDDRLRQQAQEA
jgi:hypothetical protein